MDQNIGITDNDNSDFVVIDILDDIKPENTKQINEQNNQQSSHSIINIKPVNIFPPYKKIKKVQQNTITIKKHIFIAFVFFMFLLWLIS